MVVRERDEDPCFFDDGKLLYGASRELFLFAKKICGLDLGRRRLR